MQTCRMDYHDVSADGRRLKLHVYGVGTLPVFSGIEPVTNIAECAFVMKTALPGGQELMAYGRIDVTGRADYASCKVKK